MSLPLAAFARLATSRSVGADDVTNQADEAAARPVDPDAALVERFRGGERRAFDELVRRHERSIWRVARRYLKNDADASDVAQQTFVRAFRAIDGFRGAASLRSWLYRIAITLSINHMRDHRREQPAEIAEAALTARATGPQRIIDGEDAARLRAAVAELPPKQRMVLELRVFDELSFREVAELADCTENAAKVNFHYAVKRLKELLA
jgi:RNA polymerase sigma-70 factor (ECF subfamily)